MGLVYNSTLGLFYSSLASAMTNSAANNTLLVLAGAYTEDLPDITHNLTINAIGGMAQLTRATPLAVTGRAVVNVVGHIGVSLSISGLDISGAARPGANQNGAGILFENGSGALRVENCYVHNNEDGILAGNTTAESPAGGMTVTILNSEIANNGAPVGSSYAAAGMDHNIYINGVASFDLENSYIHSVFSQGHEVKTRAAISTIIGNRIADLPTLTSGALGSSYSIDIPNAGIAVVKNNVIEKGAASLNRNVIHYAGEGMTWPANSLLVDGNTLINNRSSATFVLNQSQDATTLHTIPATISNNTLYQANGAVAVFADAFGPPADTSTNNTLVNAAGPALDTTPGYDPAATFGHWAIHTGTAGNDTLTGTAGNDYFAGSVGSDVILGAGGGQDILDYSGLGVALTIGFTGDGAGSVVKSGGGTDQFSGIATLLGAAGADFMDGSLASQALHLVGAGGNDTLLGGAGGDTLDGGPGNDSLDGGAGFNLAVFNATRTATTLTHNADGSWTAIGPEGTDLLRNVEAVQFLDVRFTLERPHDFDGGGQSDILLQSVTGELVVWEMNGASLVNGAFLPFNPTNYWKVAGTGDFYHTGRADILLQGQAGELVIWQMDGTQMVGGGALPNPGPGSSVAAVADFNRDGHDDLLLRNTDGSLVVWELNGTSLVEGRALPFNPTNYWAVAGTGDFHGDGHVGILLRGAAGEALIWEMDGSAIIGGGLLSTPIAAGWSIAGIGDFYGDGHSDILLRGAGGEIAIDRMNGTTVVSTQQLAFNPTNYWNVAATGDYQGDGHADILLRGAAGEVVVWEMNGAAIIGGGDIGFNPTYYWHLAA